MKTPHRYDEGAAGILKQSPPTFRSSFEALSKLFRASIGVQSEFVGENASLSSLNRREPFTVLSPFFHRYFTADPISRRLLGVHLISQSLHWWEALSRFFLASRPHNGRMRGFAAASLPHFAGSFCCSLVMVTQRGGIGSKCQKCQFSVYFLYIPFFSTLGMLVENILIRHFVTASRATEEVFNLIPNNQRPPFRFTCFRP